MPYDSTTRLSQNNQFCRTTPGFNSEGNLHFYAEEVRESLEMLHQ